ncbi:MAG: hypothetical protein AAF366_04210 [Pseudomonadota bacterium]
MLTQFVILAAIRSLLFQALLLWALRSFVADRARRVALAAPAALAAAALLDGSTPDGWDFEYLLGHPFWVYLFLNGPIVLAVACLLLLIPKRD